MKNSSDTLALTFAEFCHIRNVITRAELETLLFDDKLYNEVAQSKVSLSRWCQWHLYSVSASCASLVAKYISTSWHSLSVSIAMFVNRKSAVIVWRR